MWLSKLKSYLDEHDYVITLMDKNLGAAVVSREWMEYGADILLSDINNYRVVDFDRIDISITCSFITI